MSTKVTIAHGKEIRDTSPNDNVSCPAFHLFADLASTSKLVYLRIEGMPFTCSRDSVTVTMTEALWKRLAEAYRPGIVEEYLGDG